ncbi:membrane protein [Enterococcus sp. 10A9_DIV0425]|uniref:Membrane protein n=1 Tax=Candidatus Enterococcus wittei TaxID=1987383 RepID=A0A242K100_9ENTE|nr:DUF1700 domain-containing protein [Enterococcus sp. 10A9_DIV0425]OTP11255.1 membrane protein [Enterococcus sp. 10A9_DIV0425]THE15809.1 DUF1700 domain-containing protein [Enterococcus hirae]
MNEYLNELNDELREIPEDDRFDIIQYYEEYFLDADKTVDQVVEEYGTPKQFALKLKINYFSEQDDSGKIDDRPNPRRQIRLIWMIVLGLFATPLLIPLALAFIAVIIGILVALVAVIISIYVVCISILGAGLFSMISGIAVLNQSLTSGLFFVGLGLLATGSAVFFSPLLLKGTKWLFQIMMNFVKWVGRRFITKRSIHTTNSGV